MPEKYTFPELLEKIRAGASPANVRRDAWQETSFYIVIDPAAESIFDMDEDEYYLEPEDLFADDWSFV